MPAQTRAAAAAVESRATDKPPSLKRSSSTASLPTPPRTQRRRRLTKARFLARGTESDIAEEDSDTETHHGKKRRSLHDDKKVQDDEDAFWSGLPGDDDKVLSLENTPKAKTTRFKSPPPTVHDSPTSPVPMLTRRRKAEASGSVLMSPPPSHRKTITKRAVQKKPTSRKASGKKNTLPVIAEDRDVFAEDKKEETEQPKEKPRSKSSEFTFRPPTDDTFNNPFIDSPPSAEQTSYKPPSSNTRSKTKEELPMITMVARGQRRYVPNPYYDPETQGARAPKPESLLPMDHPDYEPDFRCPPKVLFPDAHRKAKQDTAAAKTLATPQSIRKPRSKGKRVLQKSEWDSSDDEGPSNTNPLLMAPR